MLLTHRRSHRVVDRLARYDQLRKPAEVDVPMRLMPSARFLCRTFENASWAARVCLFQPICICFGLADGGRPQFAEQINVSGCGGHPERIAVVTSSSRSCDANHMRFDPNHVWSPRRHYRQDFPSTGQQGLWNARSLADFPEKGWTIVGRRSVFTSHGDTADRDIEAHLSRCGLWR